MIQDSDTGTWRNPCNPGPDGVARGFPLSGGRPGSFGLTCTSGANGKCARLGYRPWKQSPNGRSLREFHQACVRMIRADYCGDGTSHTRDGTLINVYDKLRIQEPDPSLIDFEAAWGPDGAVCVRKPRIPDGVTLEELAKRCPDRLHHQTGESCSEAKALGHEHALILNRS